MDRSIATDENWKTLRRIVAMLLALADLAERASVRSHAVRCLVLWFLRPGEIVARDYLAGLTQTAAAEPAPLAIPFDDNSPTGALRLAASFRALAAAIAAFAMEMCAAMPAPGLVPPLHLAAIDPVASQLDLVAASERRDSS
jgi:hypothetical protein